MPHLLLLAMATLIRFDAAPPGPLPGAEWTVAMTSTGGAPRWEILRDPSAPSSPHVLAQTSTDATNGRYPLAIYLPAQFADGSISVRFRAVSGTRDQAAGIVWRYRDPDNYYIVRANALENNIVLYKVENGKRTALTPSGHPAGTYGVNHSVPAKEWCSLRIDAAGPRFRVFFNAQPVMEVEDATISSPGRAGLWTKADSVTHFDDFQVQPQPAQARTLAVAALSLTPEPWDKSANYAKLERFARLAAARGAQVIVAPEGFLEGYVGNQHRTPGLLREEYAAKAAETLDGPLMSRVRNLARELQVHLMTGFAERRDDRVYNSAVMFAPSGDVVLHYSKSHTMNDEPYNTKGEEFAVASTPYGQWGALICFDRQVPEAARILALKGADLLFVPAWGGYGEMNDLMMRVRAYENGVNLAFVHPKRALLIDSGGAILAESKGEDDQIVLARFPIPARRKGGLLQYRRPELYGELTRPR